MNADYRVLQDAAQWFALHADGQLSEADLQAWQLWLCQPEHAMAWRKVERISGQLQRLSGDSAGRTAGGMLGKRSGRRSVLKALALVLGGGGLAWYGGREQLGAWTAQQRTAVGERRELALADGSPLWLNTDSALDIDFSPGLRALHLYRGEVLLEVRHGARPLSLQCAAGEVRTQQARLSLRLDGNDSRVDVYSGEIALRPVDGIETMRLQAGQFARFDARSVLQLGLSDASRQAWSNGMLMANERRLDDFLAELGRYRHGHLGCDPRVAGLKVVGAFPLADTDRVLNALAATLPVRVQRTLPWWVSVEAA